MVKLDADCFKQEKQETVVFINNIYPEYKYYAINMEKLEDESLNDDLQDPKDKNQMNNDWFTSSNVSNNVSSRSDLKSINFNQKRNYHNVWDLNMLFK